MNNYNLSTSAGQTKPMAALKKLLPYLSEERSKLLGALAAMVVNSGLNLITPLIVGWTVDTAVTSGDFGLVLRNAGILLACYLLAFVASYAQTVAMGNVGQRVLFKLRSSVFTKIQSLPVAFFNQNKAGDLISRINNDTDKLNQFFSQSLMQFAANIFMIIGAGIFLLVIHPRLGAATLAPAVFLLVFTQFVSAWIRRKNLQNLQATGGLSAEVQESLDNFKVIVAFNRRDYFRERFRQENQKNFGAAISAGVASGTLTPLYGFCASMAQLVVLAYGILLIAQGDFTVGLLISFLFYVSRFYDPLRQMAMLWANFQLAMAGWDRISAILLLESDMPTVPVEASRNEALMEFDKVGFRYPGGKEVLRSASFTLEPGKTYALVGPTGGGKTTTASLMARLFDPTSGTVYLGGRDIRSYSAPERAKKIGFILQEPFLFTGTVRDNILYGNEAYAGHSASGLEAALKKTNLGALLSRFDGGLSAPVRAGADGLSLGQRQLIAFMRAVLRDPELLILDEATANIDTVTEQLLEDILKRLPSHTTRVIIAHRLNTIESADEIFFVNGGEITPAGSMEHAVDMLLHGHRQS